VLNKVDLDQLPQYGYGRAYRYGYGYGDRKSGNNR